MLKEVREANEIKCFLLRFPSRQPSACTKRENDVFNTVYVLGLQKFAMSVKMIQSSQSMFCFFLLSPEAADALCIHTCIGMFT